MKLIIKLSENDYKALKEEGVQNRITLADTIIANGVPYEERSQGVWVHHRNDYGHNIADCSLCGKAMQWHDDDEDGIPRYCWYCGASMKVVPK